MHKFPPSALVPFIHSCGVLGTRSGRLLGRLLAAARPHMAQGAFRGQELVAMICTLAKLQYRPEPGAVLVYVPTRFGAGAGDKRGTLTWPRVHSGGRSWWL